jgi:hypothetical protein
MAANLDLGARGKGASRGHRVRCRGLRWMCAMRCMSGALMRRRMVAVGGHVVEISRWLLASQARVERQEQIGWLNQEPVVQEGRGLSW